MNECRKHRSYKHAGIYKRDKYGQFMTTNGGGKVLLPADETWVCPLCRVVFIRPKKKHKLFKKRRN